jgi:hypothetical protein
MKAPLGGRDVADMDHIPRNGKDYFLIVGRKVIARPQYSGGRGNPEPCDVPPLDCFGAYSASQ